MHATSGAAHRVLPRGIAIVGGSRPGTSHAVVHIIDVATVSVAVIPILELLHRRGGIGVRGRLCRRVGGRTIITPAVRSTAITLLLTRVRRLYRGLELHLL